MDEHAVTPPSNRRVLARVRPTGVAEAWRSTAAPPPAHLEPEAYGVAVSQRVQSQGLSHVAAAGALELHLTAHAHAVTVQLQLKHTHTHTQNYIIVIS